MWNYDIAAGWLPKAALPTPRWNPVCGFIWPRPASTACPECGPSAANTHGREVVVAGGYGGGQGGNSITSFFLVLAQKYLTIWPEIPYSKKTFKNGYVRHETESKCNFKPFFKPKLEPNFFFWIATQIFVWPKIPVDTEITTETEFVTSSGTDEW